MTRRIIILAICFLATGCIGNRSGSGYSSRKWEGPSIGLTNIDKVQPGMTYGEVMTIMGEKINVGYRKTDASGKEIETIPVMNPYHEEIIDTGIKEYRVVYFLTHINKADGVVTVDELTPLVFEENRLLGKGREFLSELIRKSNAQR